MSHCLSFSRLIGWFQVSRSNVNHLLKVSRRAPTAETPVCVNIICFPSPCLSLGCGVPRGGWRCRRVWSLGLIVAHLTARALNQQPGQKEWGRGGSWFRPESCKHQRGYSNLPFLSSAVTASCLQGSFSPSKSLSAFFPIFRAITMGGGCLWSELLKTVTRATPPRASVTCRLCLQPPVCVQE